MIIFVGVGFVMLFAAVLVWSVAKVVRAQEGHRGRPAIILALLLLLTAYELPRMCRGVISGYNAGQDYRNSHSK